MPPNAIKFENPSQYLQEVIRSRLIDLEDNIILGLFERSRFKVNNNIYIAGAIPNFEGIFLDYLLRGTEELHAKAGRYEHPFEFPFFPNPQKPIIPRKKEESPLRVKNLNLTSEVKKMYLEALPLICEQGDDNHYGSSAILDIKALQDLSRRIHQGFFVAEAKYQENPNEYQELIDAKDIDKILEKLTHKPTEEQIFERVRKKGENYHVNPEFIVKLFKDKIIPLTKEAEIRYFLKREQNEEI